MKQEAKSKTKRAVVIGGSAGSVDALMTILPALSSSFSLPIIIVLHVLPGRRNGLVELLSTTCALPVKEAEDKEPALGNVIYIAPPDYHLLLEKDGCFSLSVDAPEHFSRPAIDVLFETAADAYGAALIGVLLTGANEDGARGLARIHEAGGTTIVQSPETAVAKEMPRAALQLGCVDRVLSLSAIAEFLESLAKTALQREIAS